MTMKVGAQSLRPDAVSPGGHLNFTLVRPRIPVSDFIRILTSSKARPFVSSAFLLLLVLVFTILNGNFLAEGNLRSMAFAFSISLVAASGAALVILMGSIDLSIGAVASMAGMMAAWLSPQIGMWVLLLGPAIGLLCGLMNGLLYVYLRIPSILATLGTATSLSGLILYISNGESIPVVDKRLIDFTQWGNIPALPGIVLYALLIFGLAILLHEKTAFGRILHSMGRDESTARLLGARVGRVKITAFALSGLFAGIAGTLLMSRLGTGAVSMGNYLMLEAITAVVIGGTAITGGAGGVRLTFVGVAIIVALSNGMNIISLYPYLQTITEGLTILLAVLFTSNRLRSEDVK